VWEPPECTVLMLGSPGSPDAPDAHCAHHPPSLGGGRGDCVVVVVMVMVTGRVQFLSRG